MSVEQLVGVVPPPAQPLDINVPERWAAIQSRLGVSLPTDWLAFGQRYGSGAFDGGNLWVVNPLAAGAADEIEYQCGFEFPFPVHPASPGFLPWAADENGNKFGWWTEGPPDEWSVAVAGHESEGEPERHPGPMTTFLARLFSGELPSVWRPSHVDFTPGRDKGEVYQRLPDR